MMGERKGLFTSFSSATITNVAISPKNLLHFISNHIVPLV